ncbi:serine hydrolase domain-containing protein [Tenacibaculum salmonis]|uniref:serine hydrolase domain-containing protein n=1 Tax=Tenacibaculum sp. P3-BQ1 TaxID=3232310 RepID=UPI0034DF1E98
MKSKTILLTLSIIVFTVFISYSQDKNFVGYATAFIKQDSIVDFNYVGFSDKENSLKYNSRTIQPIASVSKTFIGISLMIAQEKGLLDLDKDINEYLDFEFTNPNLNKENTITLRHLATHTSGVIDNKKAYESSYALGQELPNMELGAYLKEYLVKGGGKYSKKNFSKSSAGTKYEYSNIASALAAYIIEKASRKSFDKFTEEYIFKPLKMNNTGWFYKDIEKVNHAILYDEEDKALQPYSCAVYPDGSLKTSINDLSIYLIELMKGFHKKSKLLSDDSWTQFFDKNFTDELPIKNIDKKEPNSGIFIAYFKSGMIGHTGSDLGVSAIMMFDSEKHIGKIFMSNEDLNENNLAEFKLIWKNIEQ